MNLLEEIREYFASVNWGARELKSLPKDFPGYVIKTSEGYGVAIPYSNGKIVSEKFANCKLHNNMIVIDGKEFILNKGDSLYFDSNLPHGMKALGNQTAEFIAVIL